MADLTSPGWLAGADGAGLRGKEGATGTKVRAELKRVVNLVVADYETRQRTVDAVEHKGGGNSEGLIRRLVK